MSSSGRSSRAPNQAGHTPAAANSSLLSTSSPELPGAPEKHRKAAPPLNAKAPVFEPQAQGQHLPNEESSNAMNLTPQIAPTPNQYLQNGQQVPNLSSPPQDLKGIDVSLYGKGASSRFSGGQFGQFGQPYSLKAPDQNGYELQMQHPSIDSQNGHSAQKNGLARSHQSSNQNIPQQPSNPTLPWLSPLRRDVHPRLFISGLDRRNANNIPGVQLPQKHADESVHEAYRAGIENFYLTIKADYGKLLTIHAAPYMRQLCKWGLLNIMRCRLGRNYRDRFAECEDDLYELFIYNKKRDYFYARDCIPDDVQNMFTNIRRLEEAIKGGEMWTRSLEETSRYLNHLLQWTKNWKELEQQYLKRESLKFREASGSVSVEDDNELLRFCRFLNKTFMVKEGRNVWDTIIKLHTGKNIDGHLKNQVEYLYQSPGSSQYQSNRIDWRANPAREFYDQKSSSGPKNEGNARQGEQQQQPSYYPGPVARPQRPFDPKILPRVTRQIPSVVQTGSQPNNYIDTLAFSVAGPSNYQYPSPSTLQHTRPSAYQNTEPSIHQHTGPSTHQYAGSSAYQHAGPSDYQADTQSSVHISTLRPNPQATGWPKLPIDNSENHETAHSEDEQGAEFYVPKFLLEDQSP